jgi:hypothetical protein
MSSRGAASSRSARAPTFALHLSLDADLPMFGDEVAIDLNAALIRVLGPPLRGRLRA